jgi:hypothetical protein
MIIVDPRRRGGRSQRQAPLDDVNAVIAGTVDDRNSRRSANLTSESS